MDKNVGILKEIDKLGRIVIPKEMRERLAWDKSVEVLLTDEGILLRNPEYKLTKVVLDNNAEENNKNQP